MRLCLATEVAESCRRCLLDEGKPPTAPFLRALASGFILKARKGEADSTPDDILAMVKAQCAPAHRLILFLQQSSVEWCSSLWMHVLQASALRALCAWPCCWQVAAGPRACLIIYALS